jgi:Terpene cyclase DEP1
VQLRSVYLLLCLLGAVIPYAPFVPWLMDHGLDLPLFFRELFSTRIGAFFGMDVFVSAAVLIVFIRGEGRRLGIPYRWLPVIATALVGVSLGLPLFLYMRQVKLEERPDLAA